jgi:hypothetical protein
VAERHASKVPRLAKNARGTVNVRRRFRTRANARGASVVGTLIAVGVVVTAGLAALAVLGEAARSTGAKQAACIESFACGGGGGTASPGIGTSSTPGGGGGPLAAVGDFTKGLIVDGLWGTVKGLGTAIAHPIDTAAGVGRAARNPGDTAKAIGDSIRTAYRENPSRALGAAAFEILSLPLAPTKAGKVVSIANKLDDAAAGASSATRTAQAGGSARRGGGGVDGGGRSTNSCTGGTCTGDSCFGPGTPVATPSGERPIEGLEAGDLVVARDPETGETTVEAVVRRFVTPDREVLDLGLETAIAPGAPPQVEHLTVTPEHPFWREGMGWTGAGQLLPGEHVRTAGGAARVVSMRSLPEPITVYNLEVEKAHTYFVGVTSAWVHNQCTKPMTHAQAAQQYKDAFQKVHGRAPTDAEVAAAARGTMDDRTRSALGLGDPTKAPSGQVGLDHVADQKILDDIGQRNPTPDKPAGPTTTGLPKVDAPLAKGEFVNMDAYDRVADKLNGKVNVVEKRASVDQIGEHVDALHAGKPIPPVEVAPGNPPVIVKGYESYVAGQMAGKPVEVRLVSSGEKGRPVSSIGVD